MQWIAYLLTRSLAGLFRPVPFPVLYRISNGLAWLFYRWGYRKNVVYGNLQRCFPEKTTVEIDTLARGAYQNLADVTLESIKGLSMTIDELRRHFHFRDYSQVNDQLGRGRPVLLVGAHYNNWEWGALTVGQGLAGRALGIYKPLTNRFTDRWMNRLRARNEKIILVTMQQALQAVKKYRNEPVMVMLIADQSPSSRKAVHWVEFFGQPTACVPGPDLIARQFDLPVFGYEVQRLSRGRYELSFELLESEPAALPRGAITRIFMNRLEKTIRHQPENWLWSHRRWKIQPDSSASNGSI